MNEVEVAALPLIMKVGLELLVADNQEGKDWDRSHWYAGVPPLAVQISEYAVPCVSDVVTEVAVATVVFDGLAAQEIVSGVGVAAAGAISCGIFVEEE